MWQGDIKMARLSVTDVIKELGISKSYLYKLIGKENISIPRSRTGRYLWDENTVKILKRILNIEGMQEVYDTDSLISKQWMKIVRV